MSSTVVTLDNLKNIFGKNAFKTEKPKEIRIEPQTLDGDNQTVEDEGWVRRPLGCGGPLAVALRIKNYLFRDGSAAAQKVMLREAVTEAQGLAPSVLKGRKWPARRVAEALSNCLLASDKWNELTYASVCALNDIQILIVDTDKKTVSFAPEDPRLWKRNTSTYMMSKDGSWLFARPGDDESWSAVAVGNWISDREAAGWKIEWPLAEGTMEALREILEDAGLAIEGRLKKDELAKRAGRTQAIKHFSSWALVAAVTGIEE